MSRAFLALFLVASLVSGVLFFTPNYSAEYDEEYYEYQPFLQYDFNLHELDLKNYDENDTDGNENSESLDYEDTDEEESLDGSVMPTPKMGYLSSVKNARKALEDLFKKDIKDT